MCPDGLIVRTMYGPATPTTIPASNAANVSPTARSPKPIVTLSRLNGAIGDLAILDMKKSIDRRLELIESFLLAEPLPDARSPSSSGAVSTILSPPRATGRWRRKDKRAHIARSRAGEALSGRTRRSGRNAALPRRFRRRQPAAPLIAQHANMSACSSVD